MLMSHKSISIDRQTKILDVSNPPLSIDRQTKIIDVLSLFVSDKTKKMKTFSWLNN
jgi:hypothetical protein